MRMSPRIFSNTCLHDEMFCGKAIGVVNVCYAAQALTTCATIDSYVFHLPFKLTLMRIKCSFHSIETLLLLQESIGLCQKVSLGFQVNLFDTFNGMAVVLRARAHGKAEM